jgi:hypothetical protein
MVYYSFCFIALVINVAKSKLSSYTINGCYSFIDLQNKLLLMNKTEKTLEKIKKTKLEKLECLISEYLSGWVESCVIVNENESVYLFDGRLERRINPTTSFVKYLQKHKISTEMPPRIFVSKFEDFLMSHNVSFTKKRLNSGLVLQGISIKE